jgi:hypothetical protein
MAKDTNTIVYVMVLLDKEQVKPIFEAYAEQYLKGILSRSSGSGYYNYKKKELGVAGVLNSWVGLSSTLKARIIHLLIRQSTDRR